MIHIQNIHRKLSGKLLYQDLNLEIPDGEITVILGKSGVGKSVLLKHILGLMLPDSGQIVIDDVIINELSEPERRQFRLRFGMVFQHSALFDSMTVGDNVGLALRKLTSQPEDQIRERVIECLQAVELGDTIDMLPASLSGGMRKRIAFSRAIAMQPRYLLYDEPTTGLDPVNSELICNLIMEFCNKFKVTSIVVTHDVPATLKMADQIALLDQKQIQGVYTPAEFQESDQPLIQAFADYISMANK